MTVTVINASPRLFSRHLRYRKFSRLNHSQQELAFLETQANRLSSTVAAIYAKLSKYTAQQIMDASSLSDIP